jgi:hypothetical protein
LTLFTIAHHAVEKREERVTVLLFVVVAGDFVETELDVGDFGGNAVDGGKRPAVEVGHRLCRTDGLRSGGFVDGERIAAEAFGFEVYVGDFSFGGAATVAQDDSAV